MELDDEYNILDVASLPSINPVFRCNVCGGGIASKRHQERCGADSVVDKALEAGAKSDGKADEGKPRMSLLYTQFGKSLMSVAKVLTFGAKKYPKPPLDDSWKDVPQAKARYTDALHRHLHAALVLGEKTDEESGESHFSHAICCILFLANLKKGK